MGGEGERGTNPEAEDLKRSQGACKTATTTADPRHHQVQRHKVDRGEIISGNPQKIIPDILHPEKNVHPLGDFFLALLFASPLSRLAAARVTVSPFVRLPKGSSAGDYREGKLNVDR